MQAAYQDFMLGKSKKSKGDGNGSNYDNVSTPPSIAKYNTEISKIRIEGKISSKGKKEYRPIFKAFQGRLSEWNSTNKQLESVFRSIINLRDRIYWESSRLQPPLIASDLKQQLQEEKMPSWRNCGFRSVSFNRDSNSSLDTEDINLALSHDLLQHERMLSVLRSLLALLAQHIDEIGRRLDEWIFLDLSELPPSQQQLDRYYVSKGDESTTKDRILVTGWTNQQNILEDAREVYSLLALDLFRKQKLAMGIFNSCLDNILITIDENFSAEDSFQKTKKASTEWSGTENKDLTKNLVHRLLKIP